MLQRIGGVGHQGTDDTKCLREQAMSGIEVMSIDRLIYAVSYHVINDYNTFP